MSDKDINVRYGLKLVLMKLGLATELVDDRKLTWTIGTRGFGGQRR